MLMLDAVHFGVSLYWPENFISNKFTTNTLGSYKFMVERLAMSYYKVKQV